MDKNPTLFISSEYRPNLRLAMGRDLDDTKPTFTKVIGDPIAHPTSDPRVRTPFLKDCSGDSPQKHDKNGKEHSKDDKNAAGGGGPTDSRVRDGALPTSKLSDAAPLTAFA